MTAPIRPTPEPTVAMAAALHWFLLQLVAQGHALDTAEAALADGVATQARALRATGLA